MPYPYDNLIRRITYIDEEEEPEDDDWDDEEEEWDDEDWDEEE